MPLTAIYSRRVSMCSRDENGYPSLQTDVSRLALIAEKVYDLDWNNPGTLCEPQWDTNLAVFKSDHALFSTIRVFDLVASLADMQSDYVILPYPMLDETQDSYGTRVQDSLSLWCVPMDVKNTELSAAVMEAMAAQSYRTVTPAYFDLALKYRYSRDPETSQMVDLIQQSIYINFESLYNESIGRPWSVLRELITAQNDNFASFWSAHESLIKEAIEQVKTQIQSMQ